jgi:hypothetical protein
VLDRPVLIELIKMTLNHGVYTTRTATIASEVATALNGSLLDREQILLR